MIDKNGRYHKPKGEGGGQFTSSDGNGGTHDPSDAEKQKLKERGISTDSGKKKMTPAEKIASVHIDFDKDNILPELNEEDLAKVDSKVNKPVLLKKGVIDRNAEEHDDLTKDDFQSIIGQSLYTPSEIFPANKEKPYFHFAKIIEYNSKGKPEYGLVILDVDERKDNFEIVHAQFMRKRSFNSLKNKK